MAKHPVYKSHRISTIYSIRLDPFVGATPDDDVEVTYEKEPSTEKQKRAEELQLPKNFYNYEDKEPCPGCRGCEECDQGGNGEF